MAPNIRPDSMVLYPKVAMAGTAELKHFEDAVKMGDTTAKATLKLLRLMANHPHISNAELALIKAPLLVMCGNRDVIQLSHIIEIFRAIPRSNLCVLPGSTHFAQHQNKNLFNQTIERFFSTPFKMPNSY